MCEQKEIAVYIELMYTTVLRLFFNQIFYEHCDGVELSIVKLLHIIDDCIKFRRVGNFHIEELTWGLRPNTRRYRRYLSATEATSRFQCY